MTILFIYLIGSIIAMILSILIDRRNKITYKTLFINVGKSFLASWIGVVIHSKTLYMIWKNN